MIGDSLLIAALLLCWRESSLNFRPARCSPQAGFFLHSAHDLETMTFKGKHHSEGASRKSTTADAGSGIPRRQSERSGNAGRINMAHMKRPIPPKGKKHGFTDPRYTHGTSWELACALVENTIFFNLSTLVLLLRNGISCSCVLRSRPEACGLRDGYFCKRSGSGLASMVPSGRSGTGRRTFAKGR